MADAQGKFPIEKIAWLGEDPALVAWSFGGEERGGIKVFLYGGEVIFFHTKPGWVPHGNDMTQRC